jgi:hypothetical protein
MTKSQQHQRHQEAQINAAKIGSFKAAVAKGIGAKIVTAKYNKKDFEYYHNHNFTTAKFKRTGTNDNNGMSK